VAVHRRISTVLPTCTICGCGVETVHHALVTCTLARALREGMRSHWDLPTEEEFRFSGKEWILNLLLQARASQRDQVIFLLWRVWHHRNNVIHGDGKASIAASIPYLRNYVESFRDCTGPAPDPKGKTPMLSSHVVSHAPKAPAPSRWSPPLSGELKVNVDAGWNEGAKSAGLGVVIRDTHGQVVQSSWYHIPSCSSAEEAEALACLEGLKNIQSLYCDRAVVESDCLRVVQALTSDDRNLSHCWSTILDAKGLLRAFNHITISKVDRESNGVAHSLAQLGKDGFRGTLTGSVPTGVLAALQNDCKNTL
jgi:ribonuclease HI